MPESVKTKQFPFSVSWGGREISAAPEIDAETRVSLFKLKWNSIRLIKLPWSFILSLTHSYSLFCYVDDRKHKQKQ